MKRKLKHHLQTAEIQSKAEFFCFKFHTKSENDEILQKQARKATDP